MSVTIAVIGPGEETATDQQRAVATEVGRRLAQAGATVVCGGLGGVMAAVSDGARRAGGTVIGLLPGNSRSDGNDSLTVAIPTGVGEMRNALVVRAADAVIAIGGGYGTLSEIGLALKSATPVIGIGTWELRRDGKIDRGITVVEDASAAVAAALTPA